MTFRHALLSCVFLILYGSSSHAIAETFTVPLNPVEQTAANGNYLSAPFDFGTAFSRIDSITLEFIMPGGYEGTAMTTGNSSFFSELKFVLHDSDQPPDVPINSSASLVSSAFRISTGATSEFPFFLNVFVVGEEFDPIWPDFLYSGAGRVAWIEEIHASYHPLPDGIPLRSTTTWLSPDEIVSPTLTIVGIPVPEPGSILMLLVGMIVAIALRIGLRREP